MSWRGYSAPSLVANVAVRSTRFVTNVSRERQIFRFVPLDLNSEHCVAAKGQDEATPSSIFLSIEFVHTF